jgi:hypothetical protein
MTSGRRAGRVNWMILKIILLLSSEDKMWFRHLHLRAGASVRPAKSTRDYSTTIC